MFRAITPAPLFANSVLSVVAEKALAVSVFLARAVRKSTAQVMQILALTLFLFVGLSQAAYGQTKTDNDITFTGVNLQQAQRGVVYETMPGSNTDLNLLVSGSPVDRPPPYSYAITSGVLPDGFFLSASGQLTGVNCSSSNGTFPFSVAITDSLSNTGNFNLSINMTAGPNSACALTLTATNLVDTAQIGSSYANAVTAIGGSGSYTFTQAGGSLPPGVTLNADGTLSGTPTTSGTYTFNVRATDTTTPTPNTGSATVSITVSSGVSVAVGPTSLPAGTNGTAYSQAITPTGGASPYTCVVSSGTLPAGILLTNNTLTGTPIAAVDTYSFTITCTDKNGVSGSRIYSLNIGAGAILTLGPATLPNATDGTAYTQTVVATGGTGTGYVYTVDSGALPTGLTLSSAGAITGTPTAVGTYPFTVRAVDSDGNFKTKDYTIVVDTAVVVAVGPASLPAGTNGTAYSQAITPTGGASPYTCVVSSGTLPAGILLTNNTLTGTPTAVGNYTFTITCTDDNGVSGSREYTLNIGAGAVLTLGPATLPNATNGTAYTQTVVATGGTGTGYVYTVDSGTLPTGLAMSSSGAITGTPTAAGTYTFTVRAVDSAGNFQTKDYTIVVDPGPVLTLGPQTLSSPMQGVSYSGTVVATGGSGEGYVYTIDSGALPTGLTLSSSGPSAGAITGKTLATGAYPFTVRAVDSDGNWGLRTYTFTILERPDPSKDAEVIALIDGQFRSAGRFAEAQLSNAMRHMESLHGGLRCGISNNLNIAAGMPEAGALGNSSSPTEAANSAAAGQIESPVAFVCDDPRPTVSLWTAGSINRETTNISRLGSEALTVGLDYQVADKLIVGAAAGFGWGDNDYGRNGTSSADEATTAMAYASIGMSQSVFVDVALGKTWVDFTGQRYVTSDASLAKFERQGDVVFGSAALTVEQTLGQFLLAGQMRYDYTDINLDAFSEVSTSSYALSYDAANQSTQAFTWGVRGQTTFVYDWGNFTPIARVEMRHRIDGSYDQIVRYSDLLTRGYNLRQDMAKNGAFSASVGGKVSAGSYELNFEYGSSSTALDSFGGSEIRLGLKKKF